ncbi:MAG: branched-chain-amino-acid transaminase [Acidimicrobiales bacterium]
MTDERDPFSAPFGTLFSNSITTAVGVGSDYTYGGAAEPLVDLQLHPATHALHYGSACFEGLKAYRQPDGGVAIFRLDDHVARFVQSIGYLRLGVPDGELVRQMIIDAVKANAYDTPDSPGALYIRPTLIGTEPNIGAAASPSATTLIYILNSPVGDYFAGGVRPLTLMVEGSTPRTTPQMGMVKTGANYIMALGITLDAKRDHMVDQVLFATDGDITETGASNFFLVDDQRIITRNLDSSFLHGVTRASVITMAADLGYDIEERAIDVAELLAWGDGGEVFLSGTAAVIAPVGAVISDGHKTTFGDGQPGPNTLKLRGALTDIQSGLAPDTHGWLTAV